MSHSSWTGTGKRIYTCIARTLVTLPGAATAEGESTEISVSCRPTPAFHHSRRRTTHLTWVASYVGSTTYSAFNGTADLNLTPIDLLYHRLRDEISNYSQCTAHLTYNKTARYLGNRLVTENGPRLASKRQLYGRCRLTLNDACVQNIIGHCLSVCLCLSARLYARNVCGVLRWIKDLKQIASRFFFATSENQMEGEEINNTVLEGCTVSCVWDI